MTKRFFGNRFNRALFATLSLLTLFSLPAMSAQGVQLHTQLAGPEIHGFEPGGQAMYVANQGQERLTVNVQRVPVEEGPLSVTWIQSSTGISTVIGQIFLSESGRGQLVLTSRAGDAVPQISKGDLLSISGSDDAQSQQQDDVNLMVGVF